MKRWIALLRGINVGGNHIIPMNELVRLMETSGFSDVKTYIQSGNVVFNSPAKLKNEIAQLIAENFGFKPQVLFLSGAELKRTMENNPFKTGEGKTIHFSFFDREPESVDFDLLATLKADTEEYQWVEKTFYLHAPEGIGRSKLAGRMGRAFTGVTMTTRNLNTVNKLAEMIF